MSLWKNVFSARRSRTNQPVPPSAPEPRRLGLALGGGGGKGGAHLGILHVLHEQGVEIDAIAGTSIGAAVGVLYAAGFTLEEIKHAFRSSAIRRIAVPDSSRMGLISNKRRQILLERLLGDRTFADLPIPCAVVAVDLIKGEEVVINEGALVPALLASTALPGIFTPVQHGDELLVDGGVLNNLPVDVAFALGAQKVIAVELTGVHSAFTLPTDTPNNPLARLTLAPRQVAIAHRAFALLMDAACQRRLAQSPPDLLIRPEVGALDTLDMNHPEAGFMLGEAAAREQIEMIRALSAWRNGLDLVPIQPTS